MPVISIIIPTFNCEQTLERGLLSIIRQIYAQFEILIIDGGSTDRTIEIIHNYASYIHYWVSEPDLGIYDAMNKGVLAAKGEWVYFMGSDDELYDSNVLANVFHREIPFNCQVIYGNVVSPRFNGLYDGEFTFEKILNRNICHQAIFTHRKVFYKIGKFNLKYQLYADWDFNLRWFLHKEIKKLFIDLIIAHYADDGKSSTAHDEKFVEDMNENIIQYGDETLPSDILSNLYENIFWINLDHKNYVKNILYLLKQVFLSKNRFLFIRVIFHAVVKKLAKNA